MRRRVRNDPDYGPADEAAVVTYSRLSSREARRAAERQEPYLDARQVPQRDDDLRAYDPDRVAGRGYDDGVDDLGDLDEPRRGRRRGARGAVLVGAVALAAGMVILAYAYGVATRVDVPSSATATAPGATATSRGTLPAGDTAGSLPPDGNASATARAPAPASATPAGGTTAPLPAAEPAAAPTQPAKPAATTTASGSVGAPMDGDTAQPALAAPVSTTATPPAPVLAPKVTAKAAPPAPKPAAKPASSTDDLMAHIESLLKHDAATAGAADQPAAAPAAPAATAGPTPLTPAAQPADPNALPQLPAPNALANTPVPPADIQPPPNGVPIPPADIPNVAPSNTAAGGQ